jgi:hypothetical protein
MPSTTSAGSFRLGPAVAAGAELSTFGCLNDWILLQGQVPRAAAPVHVHRAAGDPDDAGQPTAVS